MELKAYSLSLSEQHLKVVWAALQELPGKVSYATLKEVERQVAAFENPNAKPTLVHDAAAPKEDASNG